MFDALLVVVGYTAFIPAGSGNTGEAGTAGQSAGGCDLGALHAAKRGTGNSSGAPAAVVAQPSVQTSRGLQAVHNWVHRGALCTAHGAAGTSMAAQGVGVALASVAHAAAHVPHRPAGHVRRRDRGVTRRLWKHSRTQLEATSSS